MKNIYKFLFANESSEVVRKLPLGIYGYDALMLANKVIRTLRLNHLIDVFAVFSGREDMWMESSSFYVFPDMNGEVYVTCCKNLDFSKDHLIRIVKSYTANWRLLDKLHPAVYNAEVHCKFVGSKELPCIDDMVRFHEMLTKGSSGHPLDPFTEEAMLRDIESFSTYIRAVRIFCLQFPQGVPPAENSSTGLKQNFWGSLKFVDYARLRWEQILDRLKE